MRVFTSRAAGRSGLSSLGRRGPWPPTLATLERVMRGAPRPLSVDELVEHSGLAVDTVRHGLRFLEVEGKVRRTAVIVEGFRRTTARTAFVLVLEGPAAPTEF